MENREEAEKALQRQAINEASRSFCSDDADAQVKRVTRRFTLCAIAGEMASQWGIVPWIRGEALQAAKICFHAWLATRDGTGASEDAAIVKQVMLFIEQHGASRFQIVDKEDSLCINRAGFKHKIEGKTYYYILPEVFKKEVCKGFSFKHACHVLANTGLLKKGDSRSFY